MKQALDNLSKLVEKAPTVILDHHLLRAEGWRDSLQSLFDIAKNVGHKVATAAEFLGESNNSLEFRRRELYESEKPSESFMKWASLPELKRKETMPPV
jgi:predicted metallo-beta-lactamase superfamily hydrolase